MCRSVIIASSSELSGIALPEAGLIPGVEVTIQTSLTKAISGKKSERPDILIQAQAQESAHAGGAFQTADAPRTMLVSLLCWDESDPNAPPRRYGDSFLIVMQPPQGITSFLRAIHAQVCGSLDPLFTSTAPIEEPVSPLSQRETQVLNLLVESMTSREIGAILHISSRTVDAHRANLMRKLGLHTVVDLVHYALRKNLTASHHSSRASDEAQR